MTDVLHNKRMIMEQKIYKITVKTLYLIAKSF
nr:MAG TPA: hypothetical protein [Caudoviricetes sp.]